VLVQEQFERSKCGKRNGAFKAKAGREVKEILWQSELSFIPLHCRSGSFQGCVHGKKGCSRGALVAKPSSPLQHCSVAA